MTAAADTGMSELRVDVDGGVATLTLDAPQRRNALTVALCAEITGALDRLETGGEVVALVVTGTPPAFCAGAVLGDLASGGEETLRSIYDGFLRIARSPLVTVAAVNGPAVGAGMNLALACDVRVACPSARFITRFLDLGLAPGGGHTWMLQRAVGPQASAAMVLCGDELDGEAAAAAGLAWRSVADSEVVAEATRLAAGAASAPPELVRRVKQTLREMPGVATHEAAVERELEHQLWSLGQGFAAERLAAVRRRIESSG